MDHQTAWEFTIVKYFGSEGRRTSVEVLRLPKGASASRSSAYTSLRIVDVLANISELAEERGGGTDIRHLFMCVSTMNSGLHFTSFFYYY